MQGKIKWYDSSKGYGFIETNEGNELFFHHSAITKSNGYRDIDKGKTVEFEVGEGKRGPMATNVTLIDK